MKLKAKLAVSQTLQLTWGWSGLTVFIFLTIFGVVLTLHLLTLPARQVATTLTAPGQSVQTAVTIGSNSLDIRLTSSPVPASGLLVPLGEVGQSIVQGEFGLLVDKVELFNPNVTAAPAPTLPGQLLTVHLHLTNFQGSYYKTRSLTGSTFLLKPALGSSLASSSISSLAISSPLVRKPVLDLASKTNMQFGDIASGWITFQLPDLSKSEWEATSVEFQFIPANTTNVPIRVRLAGEAS